MEETVIYADVLFIINFITDGLCLAMTALLLGRAFSPLRFVGGCLLGGLYSLAALPIGNLHPMAALVFHCAAGLVICFVALPCRSFKAVVASALCFFATCALLGGTLWAVYTLCGAFAVYNGYFYAELSPAALLASAAVAGVLLCFCIVKAKGRARARHGDVKLLFRNKGCSLFCLADSGNLLCCPFTGLPVVIAGADALEVLFGKEELATLKELPAGEGIRPIPVRGIGGSVILPSFVPEKAEVRLFGKREFKEVRLCVAIDFAGKSFGGCDGIAPINIF